VTYWTKLAIALGASLALSTSAFAVEWNFYHHQSAPLFATSRGAKLITEEIEKATNGEVKARLHLSGTLQIAPNNITVAVADGVVQIADDLFNSGNIPVAGIPACPGWYATTMSSPRQPMCCVHIWRNHSAKRAWSCSPTTPIRCR